jgi:hypothetical protein
MEQVSRGGVEGKGGEFLNRRERRGVEKLKWEAGEAMIKIKSKREAGEGEGR